MTPQARLTHADAIAVVTLDNPKVNALHPDLVAALDAAIDRIRIDDRIRCVILTGAGRCFSAGGDITYFRTLNGRTAEPYALSVHRVQEKLQLLPQPVIAAIHGAALGGGSELALACDIRIADETALFGFPEVTLGLIPAAGGTQNLPRLVPLGAARRLLFTGERVDARHAAAIGLVDQVAPAGESLDTAMELASRIARNAPLAVAAAKRSVHLGMQMGLADACRAEVTLFERLAETQDLQEGLNAFEEKRKPCFKGV